MVEHFKNQLQEIHEFLLPYQNPRIVGQLKARTHTLTVLGVPMKPLRDCAHKFGMNHPLAETLMDTSVFEYLMLGAFLADPLQLTFEVASQWLQKAQSTPVVDQGFSSLFLNHPDCHGWMRKWTKDSDDHLRYGGFALLSTYFRKEPLESMDYELAHEGLNIIKDTIQQEPLVIQNAMNNAVVMAGLHVPQLVELATMVAHHIGKVVPLVARNQCNVQSASDYLVRYQDQPRYSRVAQLNLQKGFKK